MKLFFKHLLRSVRRKPLQPLLIVFILSLSVMTAIFATALDSLLSEEARITQNEKYGAAHLAVSLDGASKSRFMFAKDAEAVLGADAKVAGCLSLPIVYGEKQSAFFCAAVDFSEIGNIFHFSFIEYREITASALSDAAFISSDFAKENGLHCGDSFSVRVFGREKTYSVAGISPLPFIEAYDVMVDSSGIVPILAGDSLLLSSMKDGFRPCNTLYISVLEGSVEDAAACLAASPTFAEKEIIDVSGLIHAENNTEALSNVVDIMILLACILAAAVVFGCLYILSTERAEENRSFMLSGARTSQLHALQYAEVLVYWVPGVGLGALCSVPLLRRFARLVGFRYAEAELRAQDVIKSALFILAVAILTVALFTLSDFAKRSKRDRKRSTALFYCPLAASVLLMALVYLLSPRIKYVFFFPFIVVFVFAIFLYTEKLFCSLASFLDARLTCRMRKTHRPLLPTLQYAIKNAFSVKILHNTARLVALLSFIVINVLLLMMGAVGHIRFANNALTADCVVLGATEKCYQSVRDCESVQSCYRTYMQMGKNEFGKPVLLFGSEDVSAFSEEMRPSEKVQGNRVAISTTEAKYASLSIGDTMKITILEKEYEIVIGELLDSSVSAILLDNEYFGLRYNLISVKGKENVTEAALFGEISKKTATELATVMYTEDLWEQRLGTLEIYIASGMVVLLVIGAFALIALIDNLWQSYRMRREEFLLYRLCGMSRFSVACMKGMEICLALLFGLALSAASALIFLPVMESALLSFSYENFPSLRYFFLFG